MVSGDVQFDQPDGLAFAPNGDLFVTHFGARPLVANMSSPAGIHRVDPRSSLTTSVVTAAEGYTVLAGITLAPNGSLFAVDSGASQLVRINPRTGGFGPAGEGITSNDYAIAFDWFRPAVIASDGDAIFSKRPGHAATREIPTASGSPRGRRWSRRHALERRPRSLAPPVGIGSSARAPAT